ncbi:MAG TPA: phosphopantothenoylcysteine decarboxylase [Planctomycetota bacterium]|jgi:phosphopantothenoylcysteine decarboxylase/phosphopantothenate--cysteine ligase|nr:phosphopantothenoylcysteine decarboxylase [Planctomycetota bacterium]
MAAARSRARKRLNVVVTAGPTREHVDPVRYLSNESSGRMGFAIAAAAAAAGHAVTLIAGPVALPTPRGVRRIDVVSAREMFAATLRAFRAADALFMAAAVCDFRPSRRLAGKWRAKERAGVSTRVTLVRNPDILAACGRQRGADPKLVVGFALETSSGIRRARRKLTRKGADFIVLNDERALNAPRASVLILGGDGSVRRLENRTKVRIARELVGLLGRR